MRFLQKLASKSPLTVLLKTSSARLSSSNSKIVSLEVNNENGIAKILLNRPPVNSVVPEFFNGIAEAVEEAEENKCRGIVLTSSIDRIFCGGLDMKFLLNPTEEYLRTLWYGAQECFYKLYGTSIPTTAALIGSAPAGGCFISTCVEYRVMVDGFKIGLNESKLGIAVPKMLAGLMFQLMPFHITEKALMTGKLFNAAEALKFGLIDEIANDKNDAILKCEKYLENFKDMNLIPRGITKDHIRQDFIKSIEKIRDQEIDCFVNSILNTKTQNTIDKYLKSLQKKK